MRSRTSAIGSSLQRLTSSASEWTSEMLIRSHRVSGGNPDPASCGIGRKCSTSSGTGRIGGGIGVSPKPKARAVVSRNSSSSCIRLSRTSARTRACSAMSLNGRTSTSSAPCPSTDAGVLRESPSSTITGTAAVRRPDLSRCSNARAALP